MAYVIPTIKNLELFRRQLNAALADTPEISAMPQVGYWSPLSGGSPSSPALIFNAQGDTISVWTNS